LGTYPRLGITASGGFDENLLTPHDTEGTTAPRLGQAECDYLDRSVGMGISREYGFGSREPYACVCLELTAFHIPSSSRRLGVNSVSDVCRGLFGRFMEIDDHRFHSFIERVDQYLYTLARYEIAWVRISGWLEGKELPNRVQRHTPGIPSKDFPCEIFRRCKNIVRGKDVIPVTASANMVSGISERWCNSISLSSSLASSRLPSLGGEGDSKKGGRELRKMTTITCHVIHQSRSPVWTLHRCMQR
jgi:hypothetical protein